MLSYTFEVFEPRLADRMFEPAAGLPMIDLSHTSGVRLTSRRFCYYVSRDSLNRRRVGISSRRVA